MSAVSTQFRLNDYMSPVLTKINKNLTMALSSFKKMQVASGESVNVAAMERGRTAAEKISKSLDVCTTKAKGAGTGQNQFNSRLREGSGIADNLMSKLKGIAAAAGAGLGLKQLAGLSDTMAGANARLNLIVDDGGSVDALKDKIFASAQASRGSYTDTMKTVAKLGLMAGDAFSGNDEIIKFSELMNKNFVIAGASAQEQSSAMYQLTQAMAAGKLQGDEYRSIMENAPLLADSIEAYMRNSGVNGTMKEWAADGLLTADVIKNALFSSADEIENRFESMPMTWAQVWESIKNRAVRALEPVLAKVNELANNPEMQAFIDGCINAFIRLALAAMTVFEWMANIYRFVQENWSIIQPIIMAIVSALLLYKAVMLVIAVVQGIIAMTNPFTLILLGVIALIAVFLIFTEQIIGCAYVAGAFFANLGATIGNFFSGCGALIHNGFLFIQNVLEAIKSLFFALLHNIGAAFVNTWKDAQINFWSFVDMLVGGIKWIADIVNKVLGVFGIEIDTSGLEKQIDWIANQKSTLESEKVAYEDLGAAWQKGMNTHAYEDVGAASKKFGETFQDGWSSNAYQEGASVGKGLHDGIFSMVDGFFSPDSQNASESILGDSSLAAADYGDLAGQTADNTAQIAENTSKSEEDLKLLREIAEREAINRFTTAEVKVDMTGMSNTISSDMDIDGFITVFTQRFEEALVSTAEGVHA